MRNFKVHVNNFPPEVISTSFQQFTEFDNEKGLKVPLSAVVTNHNATEDIFYEWSVILHHEDHSHLITSFKTKEAEVDLTPIPCDGQTYSYEIKFFVHDKTGLGPTVSQFIQPVCEADRVVLGLELSPNPVEQGINLKGIDGLDNKLLGYHVFNTHGQLLLANEGVWKNLKRGLNKEIESYVPGVYILRIMLDGSSQSFRFVKI